MSYETKARPITTVGQLDAAAEAGALLEFTAFMNYEGDPDTYDMPALTGGWIAADEGMHRGWLSRGDRTCSLTNGLRGLRAFYPITESETP